jgi:hypothetical protein
VKTYLERSAGQTWRQDWRAEQHPGQQGKIRSCSKNHQGESLAGEEGRNEHRQGGARRPEHPQEYARPEMDRHKRAGDGRTMDPEPHG